MDQETITSKFPALKMLKNRLQQILTGVNLKDQRGLANVLSTELEVELLDLAAALVYLSQDANSDILGAAQKTNHQAAVDSKRPNIKMVRYRLDIGKQHQVTVEDLKKVLVDESGVDKNNIDNINIQNSYTLIELPDNMPQDIFVHLKSVEINRQKLDIRRVKTGNNKKRGKKRSRHARQRNFQPVHGVTDRVNGG